MKKVIILFMLFACCSLSAQTIPIVDCGSACLGETVQFTYNCLSADTEVVPFSALVTDLGGGLYETTIPNDPSLIGETWDILMCCRCTEIEDDCEKCKEMQILIEDGPELTCEFNNLTNGTGWVDATADDCEILVCEGDELRARVLVDGAVDATSTYAWTPSLPFPFASEHVVEVCNPCTADISFSVTVTDENGCESSLDYNVEVKIIEDEVICTNE